MSLQYSEAVIKFAGSDRLGGSYTSVVMKGPLTPENYNSV